MSQFKTDYFRFNNVYSERYNLQIVNINNDGNTSQFGLERSINSEDGISKTTPIFYDTSQSCPSLEVELFHCDREGNPMPINDEYLKEISRWLFKSEPLPLECNGIIYYGIFTKGTRWISGKFGYFTLTFEMSSSVAWSPIMNNPIRVVGEKTIELFNKSTYYEDICPDIEVELLQGNSIKITNLTIGQIIEFNGLENNEKFRVYNDNIKQVVSLIDGKRNLFKLFNKEWLTLVYGKNIIKIESIDAKINILWQDKILLY